MASRFSEYVPSARQIKRQARSLQQRITPRSRSSGYAIAGVAVAVLLAAMVYRFGPDMRRYTKMEFMI